MLGAPAGRSPAPLLLLLQLLARPLWRQEAGPALRDRPSRAQAGRGGASIRPRRSPDSPVSARGPGGRGGGGGSRRALLRPPRRRLSHPRSLPPGWAGPAGLSWPPAPTRSAGRALEPAPRLCLGARRSRTRSRSPRWRPGLRPGRCRELGRAGGKSRENPSFSRPRPSPPLSNSAPGSPASARCGDVTAGGRARGRRPGAASGRGRNPEALRLVLRSEVWRSWAGGFQWVVASQMATKGVC